MKFDGDKLMIAAMAGAGALLLNSLYQWLLWAIIHFPVIPELQ